MFSVCMLCRTVPLWLAGWWVTREDSKPMLVIEFHIHVSWNLLRWNHVNGLENPANCASRGLRPEELVTHKLWWNGLSWLKYPPPDWPNQPAHPEVEVSEEEISFWTKSLKFVC